MKNIVIADDDAALRGALRDLLTGEEFDVEEVGSGDEVASRFGNGSNTAPDLVLMDLIMPGKGGMEVLRELRQKMPPPLPVIVMTAHGSAKVAIEAIQLGAYDYVTKPFDLDDVLLTIQRYRDWRRLNDDVAALASQLGRRDPDEILV